MRQIIKTSIHFITSINGSNLKLLADTELSIDMHAITLPWQNFWFFCCFIGDRWATGKRRKRKRARAGDTVKWNTMEMVFKHPISNLLQLFFPLLIPPVILGAVWDVESDRKNSYQKHFAINHFPQVVDFAVELRLWLLGESWFAFCYVWTSFPFERIVCSIVWFSQSVRF